MQILIVASGLFLTYQGMMYLVFTGAMRGLASHLLEKSADQVRMQGVFALSLSVFLVWVLGASTMGLIVSGLFVMFALEGAFFALFPNAVLGLAASVEERTDHDLKLRGGVCLALGAIALWLSLP